MAVLLPRMTNQQYEYVENQGRRLNISFKICPTCGSRQEEIIKGSEEYDWPANSTYKYLGEEHICECADQIELLRHYILADIPSGYWRLGEQDYWGDSVAIAKVKDYLAKYDQYKLNGFGIELFSPQQGVGKTMLANILGKNLIQRGEKVLFTTMRDTIGLFNRKELADEKLNRIRTSPVLIIDEVQAGITQAQGNFFAVELEDLLRFRTSGNSVTIITTNLTPKELDEEYPRCFSLLASKQIVIEVNGDDARRNGEKKLFDLALSHNGEIRPIV